MFQKSVLFISKTGNHCQNYKLSGALIWHKLKKSYPVCGNSLTNPSISWNL